MTRPILYLAADPLVPGWELADLALFEGLEVRSVDDARTLLDDPLREGAACLVATLPPWGSATPPVLDALAAAGGAAVLLAGPGSRPSVRTLRSPRAAVLPVGTPLEHVIQAVEQGLERSLELASFRRHARRRAAV